MVSAVMSLTKGNWLSIPMVAASAVLPVPAGPSRRQVSKGFLSLVLTCTTRNRYVGGSARFLSLVLPCTHGTARYRCVVAQNRKRLCP